MSDNVYKHIQLTGTSSKSIEDAVTTAIARANKTVGDPAVSVDLLLKALMALGMSNKQISKIIA